VIKKRFCIALAAAKVSKILESFSFNKCFAKQTDKNYPVLAKKDYFI
jgi:hypothetical protein